MKKILIILIGYFFLSINSFSLAESNCDQFNKFTAKYVECAAKDLNKNIKKSKFKDKFIKFKNKKTLMDLIK